MRRLFYSKANVKSPPHYIFLHSHEHRSDFFWMDNKYLVLTCVNYTYVILYSMLRMSLQMGIITEHDIHLCSYHSIR